MSQPGRVKLEIRCLNSGRLIGFGMLSIIAVILALLPFALRLKIGKDYVKSYFLNFCISNIHSSNVQVVEYSNLFHGGLGFGKGLNIRVKNGISKTYSIGEKLYGKEAIEHAKRALEHENSKN